VAPDSGNVPSGVSTCSFVNSMGLQPACVIHNNLAGYTRNLLLHVQPANQPTITGVCLCHKEVVRLSFIETRVIRYQPFVSVRNTDLYSEFYKTQRRQQNTCNTILPTNIQYLKIHGWNKM